MLPHCLGLGEALCPALVRVKERKEVEQGGRGWQGVRGGGEGADRDRQAVVIRVFLKNTFSKEN